MSRKRGRARKVCTQQTEHLMEKEDRIVKKVLGCVAVLLLVVAVPMWAANERDIVNPSEPSVVIPPDPNSPMWSGPEAVLYDNGPLVTHPGGGFGGADASALQTALGLNTYGFGNQFLNGYRMADDFTVTDAGGWDVQSITFFAYQTGSTTTSTITGVYLQIWNGDPSAGGTVIWGDLTTNRMASTAWTNAYRVLDTDLLGSTRPIMASAATIGTTLAAGTYWLDWMTDGTLASGPWAPPISILGQTVTGNALQYTTAWAPALDTGTAAAQQGMPFIIEGVVVPVELQSFDVE